jgi:tetratricopeptide (TPR) repeat protein
MPAIPSPTQDARRQARLTRRLDAAIAAHERAIALRLAGRPALAERACRAALAGYRASEGPRHPDVANALHELGLILEVRDRLKAARRCQAEAVVIASRSRDPEVVRLVLMARLARAGLDRALGDYGAAARGLGALVADIPERLGPRDPLLASALNALGVLRKAQGRYAEALACYRRALRLIRRGDRAARATLEHNLGGSEHARGRYAAAEPHARRSVALRTAALGPDHPEVAADVAALAAIVEGRGRLAEAAALYRRALGVFRRRLGPRSLEVGLGLASLATVEQRAGRLARARALYRRALSIQSAVLGPRHADVAMTVNNLAVLEREAGDDARAAALFRRAHAAFRSAVGPRHPHTRLAAANLSAVSRG